MICENCQYELGHDEYEFFNRGKDRPRWTSERTCYVCYICGVYISTKSFENPEAYENSLITAIDEKRTILLRPVGMLPKDDIPKYTKLPEFMQLKEVLKSTKKDIVEKIDRFLI